MDEIRLAVIGAGGRGRGMAGLAIESEWPVRVTALADPSADARRKGGELLSVATARCFTDHRELLEQCQGDVDAAIVASTVDTHAEVACDCLRAGVRIFLEKPITRTIAEAMQVLRATRETGVPLMVGFNLRYAPFYMRLKELVSGGALGELISIEWKETLSPIAWAVGYCRASWYSRTATVGGWLLEKSCHDIDQINWLAAAPCVRVASFGSRSYFLPRQDVPERCSDGCPLEKECLFSCFRLYPDGPVSLPNYVPPERWDLCVYNVDSDLMDRQVAILEYENGVTAAFSILPVGNSWERTMRICGSDATLQGCDAANEIRIFRHDATEPIVENLPDAAGGHGGADPRIIGTFLRSLRDGSFQPETSVEVGVESMLAAGGIELARAERRVIELAPYREEAGL